MKTKITVYLVFGLAVVLLLVILTGVSGLIYSWSIPVDFHSFGMMFFLFFIIGLIIRYGFLLGASFLQFLSKPPPAPDVWPKVSVILPAYNEGLVIESALDSLLTLDYPRLEIVVVDDGSSDDTFVKAMRYMRRFGEARVRVIRQKNGGKSKALNTGLLHAHGEFVLCMDGDSSLSQQGLRKAVSYFADPGVGAVAGNIKVRNRRRLLGALQALEYIEGLNLVRRAQAHFNAVGIIPGPFGVFRRSALIELGGYEHDTFAEDCDITIKLLGRGWKTCYESSAIAYTEAPSSLLDLIKQRYRWTRGILQVLLKQRGLLGQLKDKPRASIILWCLAFEGLVWPVINVLGLTFFAVFICQGVLMEEVLALKLLFIALDVIAAFYCIALEGEQFLLLPLVLIYRAFFSPIVDVYKIFATIEELFNIPMTWNKLDRIGEEKTN